MTLRATLARLLAGLLLVSTTPALAQALPANGPQIAIGHRGAPAYAPEHTFFSYDKAIELDVDMIECDLHLTKDGVLVCIHDETVDRTSESSGNVVDFTLAELRQMDFGTWYNTMNPTTANPAFVGAKIVPFEEQIDCYLRLNPKMRIHVETKVPDLEDEFVALLQRKGLVATGDVANGNVQSSTIVVQSFIASSLDIMKQLAPTLPTAFLYSAPADTSDPASPGAPTWHASGDGPDYIDAFAPTSFAIAADPTVVQRYHAAGHDVHTWTPDTAQEIGTLLDLGVDGIFSNKPDIVRAEIDSRGTGVPKEERGNPANFERGCPGIAGRVTSADGPGDVWEPTGTRGVQLVSGTSTTTSSGTGSGLLLGGSPGAGLLAGFLLAGLARRALKSRACGSA
jgi:glycerophosphoryl diester phosphodiesterase